MIVALTLAVSIPGSAREAESMNRAEEFYSIVQEIGAEYGLNIDFTPCDEITTSPQEFREILEAYAISESGSISSSQGTLALINAPTVEPTVLNYTKTVSGISNGWEIGATASYYWNSTTQRYLFSSGSNVFVTSTNALGQEWFDITSSGCTVRDGGRTLFITATGTANYYSAGSGLVSFNGVTKSVEVYSSNVL